MRREPIIDFAAIGYFVGERDPMMMGGRVDGYRDLVDEKDEITKSLVREFPDRRRHFR